MHKHYSNSARDVSGVIRGKEYEHGKAIGHSKWFDDKKGFGFISNQQGQDVFLHYKEIIVDGYKRARDGDVVKYLEASTDKGFS